MYKKTKIVWALVMRKIYNKHQTKKKRRTLDGPFFLSTRGEGNSVLYSQYKL